MVWWSFATRERAPECMRIMVHACRISTMPKRFNICPLFGGVLRRPPAENATATQRHRPWEKCNTQHSQHNVIIIIMIVWCWPNYRCGCCAVLVERCVFGGRLEAIRGSDTGVAKQKTKKKNRNKGGIRVLQRWLIETPRSNGFWCVCVILIILHQKHSIKS